jgi:hypothetical protein
MLTLTREISLAVDLGGNSEAVAVSGTSAQSSLIGSRYALVTPTVPVFVRAGADPVAVDDGSDIILNAGVTYRIQMPGQSIGTMKLAFICTNQTGLDSGTVYVSPGQ